MAALALPVRNTFVHFLAREPDASPTAELDGSPVEVRRRRARSEGRRVLRVAEFGPLAVEASDEEEGCCSLQMERVNSDRSTALESSAWSSESEGCSDAEVESELQAVDRSYSLPMEHVASDRSTDSTRSTVTLDSALSSDSEGCNDSVDRRQPQLCRIAPLPTFAGSRLACAVWTVPLAELTSTRTKICSGQFFVPIPGVGFCPFEAILYAEHRMSRSAQREVQGFERSRGRGRLEVRCRVQLPSGTGNLMVDLSVGALRRGAAMHDFSKQACLGWRHVDFRSAVDPATCSMLACAHFSLPQ